MEGRTASAGASATRELTASAIYGRGLSSRGLYPASAIAAVTIRGGAPETTETVFSRRSNETSAEGSSFKIAVSMVRAQPAQLICGTRYVIIVCYPSL